MVEGIFDVINLHDKGLTNAVCCFGVKNVTEEKLQVLSVQGIDRIDVFLREISGKRQLPSSDVSLLICL